MSLAGAVVLGAATVTVDAAGAKLAVLLALWAAWAALAAVAVRDTVRHG